jgi:hypothetical protein
VVFRHTKLYGRFQKFTTIGSKNEESLPVQEALAYLAFDL